MPKEIETKFKIASQNSFKKSLKKIGAKFISKELEQDAYYRLPARHLSISAVRLRSIGNKGIFTIKSLTQGRESRLYKVRDELEVKISDVKTFSEMLRRLGLVPHFRKEKIRETYKWKRAKISIDTLPFIGSYVEIEATKNEIKKIAHLLNLDMKKGIPETYMQLFNYYKILHKKPRLELVFDRKKAI